MNSSADQLNYTNVTTPGIAVRLKALDENRSIKYINSLSATELTGTLLTGVQPYINSLATVSITSSLSLTGIPVRATADELNYVYKTIPGQATAQKAFVFDATTKISGINTLTAASLIGTLITSAQPYITSIGTLSSLNVNGFIGIGTKSPAKPIEIVSATPTIRLSNGTASAELRLIRQIICESLQTITSQLSALPT